MAPRILVVYKKDAYQQYIQEQQDAHLVRLLRQKHPDMLDMQRAHTVHKEALESVVHELRKARVRFDWVYRADLRGIRRYQLVVSVGGDGTFLQAARSVENTPILGVNSDPRRSEAVFCAATTQTFAGLLHRALEGQLPELHLHRLLLVLNGRKLDYKAINDVLIVHDDPAALSRYRLSIRGRSETQKSSGLWVSTAAGSSSAIWAAGGARLPWGVKAFQYRPRELYRGRLSNCRLLGGVLRAPLLMRVTWLMRRGSACIDGSHIRIPLRLADELQVRLDLKDPLRVLGLSASHKGNHRKEVTKSKRPAALAAGRTR